MFQINADKSIYITRGDIASIDITAKKSSTENYIFQPGDTVQLKVFEKKKCDNIVILKSEYITKESEIATIRLDKNDTKIGDVIHKPLSMSWSRG